MKELMWTFDIDYVTWNTQVIVVGQLFATLCLFSTIVLSALREMSS